MLTLLLLCSWLPPCFWRLCIALSWPQRPPHVYSNFNMVISAVVGLFDVFLCDQITRLAAIHCLAGNLPKVFVLAGKSDKSPRSKQNLLEPLAGT